jgi:hypothetical protein
MLSSTVLQPDSIEINQGETMKILKTVLMLCLTSIISQTVSAESIWDKPIENAVDNVSAKVYRSATCGCCKKWIQHIKQHNIIVEDNVLETRALQQLKLKFDVTPNLQSCHTAVIGSHVVEGHVPAADIMSMLNQKTQIYGLTVPQMVTGSPGMEMGGRKDPFSVISFDQSGKFEDYNSYSNY